MNENSSPKTTGQPDKKPQVEERQLTGRRLQDDITSKDPTGKMNLDRRKKNRERRTMENTEYKGLSRRYTIDRRFCTSDRRVAE